MKFNQHRGKSTRLTQILCAALAIGSLTACGSDDFDATEANPSVVFGNLQTLFLRNNTYQVFAVAEIAGTDIILTQDDLVLDTDSGSLNFDFNGTRSRRKRSNNTMGVTVT